MLRFFLSCNALFFLSKRNGLLLLNFPAFLLSAFFCISSVSPLLMDELLHHFTFFFSVSVVRSYLDSSNNYSLVFRSSLISSRVGFGGERRMCLVFARIYSIPFYKDFFLQPERFLWKNLSSGGGLFKISIRFSSSLRTNTLGLSFSPLLFP